VLYNVHHLSSNKVDPVARVAISTIQRVYSILRGDPALDPEADVAVDPEAGLTSVRRL
jgi:type I restriction enzyme, R subunit